MAASHGSIAQTRGIEVRVTPEFLPAQSDPETNRFVFGYHIVISNMGELTVQLLARHWIIVDADGERREVRGSGVVGERPILSSGESFAYSSSCPLGTDWGTMEGSYTFRNVLPIRGDSEEGKSSSQEKFAVTVGRFYLVSAAENFRR